MSVKEIFASVEIADHQVRIVVGEFFESRLNILRVERAGISGIKNKKIVDEQNVINGIRKALKAIEDNLGYHIERVLLAIPSVHVVRTTTQVNVVVNAVSKRIKIGDIQRGRNEALATTINDDLVLVNVGCIKYITNGITSRKMPINELCDEFRMDVDLLFADKEIVYSYASVIEKSGLKILDICLDAYAIAAEAAIFEQTLDKNVVLLDVERDSLTLSLFSHGKLVSCELEEDGYSSWLKGIKDEFAFSPNVAYRLAQSTCCLKVDEAKDTSIYIFEEHKKQRQLSEREVASLLAPKILEWIERVNATCEQIVQSGDMKYVVVGSGAEVPAISQLLDNLNAPWQIYVPAMIGARDSSLVCALGCFYSWKESLDIRKDDRTSCAQQEVDRVMDSIIHKSSEASEGSFTKRLKKMILNDK